MNSSFRAERRVWTLFRKESRAHIREKEHCANPAETNKQRNVLPLTIRRDCASKEVQLCKNHFVSSLQIHVWTCFKWVVLMGAQNSLDEICANKEIQCIWYETERLERDGNNCQNPIQ